MVSVIITAYKEPETIGKAIESIIDNLSSLNNEDVQIIQVSPDQETLKKGKQAFEKFSNKKINFLQIVDPNLGKPHALNLAFEKVNYKEIILTDGDVYFDKNVVPLLLNSLRKNNVGGVTGRPLSVDPKNNFMGYISHLLADAAHHKRMVSMKGNLSGKSKYFVKKDLFFPMSGYIMAIKNLDIRLPEDVLADDAYISYIYFNKGYKLDYVPEARVFVKYPKNINDYFIQKKRALGGYIQLWKYGVVNQQTKARSFWKELQYFWYPLKYSQNLKEFIWSILFYPIRLLTWILIWWERKILHKDFYSTWTRVESTK